MWTFAEEGEAGLSLEKRSRPFLAPAEGIVADGSSRTARASPQGLFAEAIEWCSSQPHQPIKTATSRKRRRKTPFTAGREYAHGPLKTLPAVRARARAPPNPKAILTSHQPRPTESRRRRRGKDRHHNTQRPRDQPPETADRAEGENIVEQANRAKSSRIRSDEIAEIPAVTTNLLITASENCSACASSSRRSNIIKEVIKWHLKTIPRRSQHQVSPAAFIST